MVRIYFDKQIFSHLYKGQKSEYANLLQKIRQHKTSLFCYSHAHFGDCKTVGDGIREMRINFAKGYRIYFKEKDGKIVVLLIGGDKSTQQKDIAKAKEIWKKLNK